MCERIESLKNFIANYDSVIIAFSGGVDSTFLAKVAGEVVGIKVLLITATSSTYPQREYEEAVRLAQEMNLTHRTIVSEEIDYPGFSTNPPDRCYHCKKELFRKIHQIASSEGYAVVFDGSNIDDTKDYRPGFKALSELGTVSPLREMNFTKDEIRKYSTRLGLPTADKPSFACLASRFPYGEEITYEKLKRVGDAEEAIRSLGFKQFRVRSHKDLARLEFSPSEMESAWDMRNELERACRKTGFVFVALDLLGYRTGAMNETLTLLT